jgi:L-alanine-DL-glutamate epimerase-like enolase superfamily enzyme
VAHAAADRIDALETSVYVFPTDGGPHADGTLTWDHTVAVVVELRADGATGLGWTYSHRAAQPLVDDVLAPRVVGQPCDELERTWRHMVDAVRNIGRPGLAAQAIAAVDIAWWDLRARRAEQPLHVLLGAPPAAKVPVYGSGGFTNLDEATLDAQLEHWLRHGCAAVKIKVGEGWGAQEERDLARARHVAERCRGRAVTMVDANGAYTPVQARRMMKAFEDVGVVWFEEPVSSDELDELAVLRTLCRCDIAAGEYADSTHYVRRMLAAESVDCLQLDVTRCAGITEWRRCAQLADAYGVPVSGHCAPALHAAVAAATPHLRHVELFWDHERLERLLVDGAPATIDGRLVLTSAPGHGMRLAESADRFRVR